MAKKTLCRFFATIHRGGGDQRRRPPLFAQQIHQDDAEERPQQSYSHLGQIGDAPHPLDQRAVGYDIPKSVENCRPGG